jgi:hypothetical protein
MLVTTEGETTKLRKWANDKHPDFDALYGYLLGLCQVESGLVHEGPYEGKWRPEGFDSLW